MPIVINEMEIDQAEPPKPRGEAGGDGGGGGGGAAPPSEDDFERALEEQIARCERLRAH